MSSFVKILQDSVHASLNFQATGTVTGVGMERRSRRWQYNLRGPLRGFNNVHCSKWNGLKTPIVDSMSGHRHTVASEASFKVCSQMALFLNKGQGHTSGETILTLQNYFFCMQKLMNKIIWFWKGKPRMRSSIGFIHRQNSGYFWKIFRIAEKGSFWVWSRWAIQHHIWCSWECNRNKVPSLQNDCFF